MALEKVSLVMAFVKVGCKVGLHCGVVEVDL